MTDHLVIKRKIVAICTVTRNDASLGNLLIYNGTE